MTDDEVKINEEYYSKGILEAGVDGVFRHNDNCLTRSSLVLGRKPSKPKTLTTRSVQLTAIDTSNTNKKT